jgi:DNA-binding MarR family transcriptional regulator
MGSKLQEEIKQSRPFTSLEEEVLLNIHRTSDRIQHYFQQTIKPLGLTPTQYNVLRILRGAGENGLRCSEVGERLVSSDPDITRLLDRLQKQKLLRRKRDAKDRRVIYTTITAEGLRLLKELDPLVTDSVKQLLKHVGKEKLTTLVALLEEVRQSASLDKNSDAVR